MKRKLTEYKGMSENEKKKIASEIKPLIFHDVNVEMNRLIAITSHNNVNDVKTLSNIGNDIVDYFTFKERLETRGKYGVNFYEFVANIDIFQKKKFIRTMLNYYQTIKNKNNTKHKYVVYKEVYNICISTINIMKPINCIRIFLKYPQCQHVLNFCCGWGGSAVAAAAMKLKSFVGIDINCDLKKSYDELQSFLSTKSTTNVQLLIRDATLFDYSTIFYDLVFVSPPYYSIEKYRNNVEYTSKQEMNELFYKPCFQQAFQCLQKGGIFIVNVCKEVYNNVLLPMFGEAHDIYPLNKSTRALKNTIQQNRYKELCYVWIKNCVNV